MDVAHKQTDNLIDTTERKIKREYAKAQKEIESKANAYFASFADKDKKMLALVDEGKMSQDAYNAWRTQQLLVGKRWQDMSASLSRELANARGISASIVKGYMPEAYAENINFATYEIEAGTGVDTSFTLYDRQTVERIMRDNPQLLPDPSESIKDKIRQKQIDRWSKSKMTSALTRAILQGESIDKLAKRLRSVTSMDAAASLRNARTMMTNAQNAGRYDGYRRAKAMGVKFKVMWIATLDNRTRHEHRLLDGQMQEVDEPFTVGGIKIMYPADYGGKTYKVPPDMIYNCRCSIGAAVKGTRLYDEGIGAANREVGTGQTYEEWKNAKAKDKLNKPVEAPKPQKPKNDSKAPVGDMSIEPSNTRKNLDSGKVQRIPPVRYDTMPSEQDIIQSLCGGDLTKGSCASLSLAYAGNKGGIKVKDYRGGMSQQIFSRSVHLREIAQLDGVESVLTRNYNDFKAAHELLTHVQDGKEYCFGVGKHMAVVKKVGQGFKYLEMQSGLADRNGWHDLDDSVLRHRFGCKRSHSTYGMKLELSAELIETQSLAKNTEFQNLLGYLNTQEGKEQKGAWGSVK